MSSGASDQIDAQYYADCQRKAGTRKKHWDDETLVRGGHGAGSFMSLINVESEPDLGTSVQVMLPVAAGSGGIGGGGVQS